MSRPHQLFVRNEDQFFVGFSETLRMPDSDFVALLEEEKFIPSYFYFLDGNGHLRQPADKIFEVRGFVPLTVSTFRGGPSTFTLPSDERSLMTVSTENRIFSAESEDFLIKIHDPQGEYLRAFYYPYEKAPLNPDDIINRYDQAWQDQQEMLREYKRIFRVIAFPETWPALNSMLVDDENRLWISTIVDDDEVFEWWVLDEYGELLARFKWPGNRLFRSSGVNEIQMVKNENLYVYEYDEETGIEKIVRYRIDLEEI